MKCEICGKEVKQIRRHFLKSHKDLRFKEDYYDIYLKKETDGICKICNKPTLWLGYGYKNCCSDECSIKYTQIRTTDAVLKKYGVRNVGMVKEFIDKAKETYYRKTGYDNPAKNPEVKEKIKNHTDYDLIGRKSKEYWKTVSVEQKKEFVRRNKLTKLEKYGAENYNNLKAGKETKLEKYGAENYNNREKSKETSLTRYGTEHPCKNKVIANKISNALKGRKIKEETRNKIIANGTKIVNEKFKNIDKNFIKYENRMTTIHCPICNNFVKMKHALYYVRLKNKQTVCTICNPISEFVSGSENTLFNFIKSIYSNELIKNDRKILNGKELDIFIPEKKLAIEFDGLYWHNNEHVYDTFHLWKTEECEKQGIQLIHVFEDEWIYKQEIVKSRLKSLLGLNDKIYARKTEYKIIDADTSNTFLDNNHIEGTCPAVYHYGLFYNDELVSVMTFGKNKDDEFELLRFANKLYTNVIGGASKLFSHFRKDHPEVKKNNFIC